MGGECLSHTQPLSHHLWTKPSYGPVLTRFKSYLTTFVFIMLQFDSDKFEQRWLLMIIYSFIKIHSDKSFFIPEYLIQIISILISNNDIKLFSEMSHSYQNWIKYLGCIWRNLLKRWVHNPLELRPISTFFVLFMLFGRYLWVFCDRSKYAFGVHN